MPGNKKKARAQPSLFPEAEIAAIERESEEQCKKIFQVTLQDGSVLRMTRETLARLRRLERLPFLPGLGL